ncbi:uncharacterized protein LOC101854605 [Aplysia californica]|uniref:Uncharacterized protein LOC101854605 n=1 Tax=Aplysia californica TaxID=6500 RepID=A0ABM0K6J6_APLCA|nr:uncharacterized protein LOC101854605 [Aplysia californica]
MESSVIPVVIGVDIGGTNTDVVLICHRDGRPQVLSEVKELTSSDVTTGVKKAVLRGLLQAKSKGHTVNPIQVNIGTTHFVNAVVQGKDLAKVAVIRICGPVSEELPPFSDIPAGLTNIIRGSAHLVHGGFRYDGKEHEPIDEAQLRDVIEGVKKQGITNIAYIGIFSPTRPDQELRAREITREVFPEASVSLSHEIGHIGILQRENATILNECLKPLCKKTVSGFQSALEEIGVTSPVFLTQNDGTIISSEGVLEQPVLTFASGPTNSMRGATFLSELKDAIVIDIGGTTADAGVLKNGFPREASTHVKVGGVRTNFRMPDVVSVGLGGGSYVRERRNGKGELEGVAIGPRSAGLNLLKEALIFGDGTDSDSAKRSTTTTDIAVAAGFYKLGDPKRVKGLDEGFVRKSVEAIHAVLEELVDRIKLSREELPVVVVGGGSIVIDRTRPMRGATELIVPEHFGVANAIGAALSKVSASLNTVVSLLDLVDTAEMEGRVQEAVKATTTTDDPDGTKADLATNEARKPFFSRARDAAIEEICRKVKTLVVAAGADETTIEILDKQDSVIPYMPGNATQIFVKMVGDLAAWSQKLVGAKQWSCPENSDNILALESYVATNKQTYSSTGQRIDDAKEGDEEEETKEKAKGDGDVGDEEDDDATKSPKDPYIDRESGEWILSEYDIECIAVGAGIYGCGGGGSPHMGRLRAFASIRSGKRMRVVNPDRFLKDADPETDIVIVTSMMGAPLITYEQGESSAETVRSLECLRDLYQVGGYKDGDLQNKEGVTVTTTQAGVKFIQNYHPSNTSQKSKNCKIIGVMAAEIGGSNAIEPFLVGANLDLPVIDADGMSRAFPEVQMFIPYMYNSPAYPLTIVGSGNSVERSALLYSPGNKLTENFLRDVTVDYGGSAGLASSVTCDEVMTKTALHTVSSAWRLGDAILRARVAKESVIEAVVKQEDAKHIITGKITDVQRETSGG